MLALGVSLALAPGFARAAPPPASVSSRAVEEARGRFQKAIQLFRDGNLESALAEFRGAYQAAPSYRVLYNIAQVQLELHDDVEALKTFRQYLVDGGAEIPSERRAKVESDIEKLEGRVAYLEITTNVDGAQISVDDVPVGVSPLEWTVPVKAGPRKITVAKGGYGFVARSVTVAGGDRARIACDIALAARPAAEPSGGRIPVWVGLATTGVLAAGFGTFALMTRDARSDFDRELEHFPTTKDRVDDARSRMKTYAAIADGMGAAALVSGAITMVLALSNGAPRAAAEPRPGSLRVAPRVGGITVSGDF